MGFDQLAQAFKVQAVVSGGRSADDVRVGVVQVDAVKMDPVRLAEMPHSNSAD